MWGETTVDEAEKEEEEEEKKEGGDGEICWEYTGLSVIVDDVDGEITVEVVYVFSLDKSVEEGK